MLIHMSEAVSYLNFIQITQSIIIRVNEYGLHEAANYTKQWLQRTIPKIYFNTFEYQFEKVLNTNDIKFYKNFFLNYFFMFQKISE